MLGSPRDHRTKFAGRASARVLGRGSRRALLPLLLVLWTVSGFVTVAQTSPPRNHDKPASTRGKQTFSSTCAGCHGLDGRGNERAPNIVENPRVRRLSDAELFSIIKNGIPGTGMPAFHSLEAPSIKGIVIYLHALQGAEVATKLPGDPERGQTIFFGKAGCSSCHMVAGKGGFIASDLSAFARTNSVDQTRRAIANPAPRTDRQARMVTLTTRAGEKFVGRIRNEDNFSLQLQTLDGTFYFVAKTDLEGIEFSSQSLMPSDYASTLSADELNDLVSYLIRVASAKGPGILTKSNEDE